MRTMKKTIWFGLAMLAISSVASATMTFQQLDENTFSVSHKVKWIGGRGQAMELVYDKAASLCIAAGYSHLELFGQESNAPGYYQSANATLTVKFFQDAGEDRIACDVKASDEYIKQAITKPKKRGYKGPTVVDEPAESQKSANQCTVEQISAMVKAGMTESQIKAACGETN
jgi:hypothetical protein